MERVHIIAEAGSNYNGEISKAKELIDIGLNSGADSIKFQMINTYGLYLPGKYEYGHYDIDDVLKFREKCNLKEIEWDEIFSYGKNKKINLSASVFDKISMDILIKHSPDYVKIASSDLNNIKFLLDIAQYGKKMILSTGMATLNEIEKTINILSKEGINDIVLMHCVSVYPCELQETNLNFITTLQSTFGYDTGFSDHTKTSIASCLAIMKGVKWIEKHFTMDNTLPGLDHVHAMNEKSLTSFIQDIRNAEKALSSQEQKISEKEDYTKKRARRALYASRDIKPGETIQEKDILIVRPQGPLSADQYFDIIGKKMTKDIKKHDAFSFDKID